MCALFGFLDYGKRVPWRILQKLVQALANASEVRGHHAASIAYNKADTLTIFKRPKPAHKLHFRIPQGTAAVMGHTRLTTQGDQKFNQKIIRSEVMPERTLLSLTMACCITMISFAGS